MVTNNIIMAEDRLDVIIGTRNV